MKRIVVHIDQLVLRGFRHEDRQGIAQGLQQELARLLGAPQAGQQVTARGDMPRLQGGSIQLGQGAKPQCVGLQIGRRIGKEITK